MSLSIISRFYLNLSFDLTYLVLKGELVKKMFSGQTSIKAGLFQDIPKSSLNKLVCSLTFVAFPLSCILNGSSATLASICNFKVINCSFSLAT